MNADQAETTTTSPGPAPAAGDRIRLLGVGGIGYHGVLSEERRDGQTFLADLTLDVDTRAAAAGDDLARTVNYAELAQAVVRIIEGEPVQLIETLATRIAAVALGFDPVDAATVTVHKPDAPVGVPFTDVEVTITRTRADDLHTASAAQAGGSPEESEADEVDGGAAVVLPEELPAQQNAEEASGPRLQQSPQDPTPVVVAIGGNVGDVRGTLRAVVADLRTTTGLSVQDVSPLARTAPVLADGAAEQPDFLNAVVLATTTLAPLDLLAALQDIEEAYGRRRTVRWGERTLDLDIILYGSVTSDDETLMLPHPRASERAFVLVPWAQADPDAFLPGLGGGPVATLAETAPDRTGVRWLALDWLDERPRASTEAPAPAVAEPEAAEVPAPAAAEPPAAAGIARASFPPPAPVEPAEPAVPGEESVHSSAPASPDDPAEAATDAAASGEASGEAGSVAEPAEQSGLPWTPSAAGPPSQPITPKWQPLHRPDGS